MTFSDSITDIHKLNCISIKNSKTGLVIARFLFKASVIIAGLCSSSVFAQSDGLSNSLATSFDETTNASGSPSHFHGDLARVQTLIKANVLELAESILESQGPPILPNDTWLNWEHQLWTLYRVTGKWEKLYERTRQIPPAFPFQIRSEADYQAILASIELDKGARARALLRKYLLSSGVSDSEKRRLRKLLIESYLVDDYLDEARVSMRNYQSDYRSQEEDWLLLSAQVYIQLNDPDNAVNILAPLDPAPARLLRMNARLRNNSISPDQAIEKLDVFSQEIEKLSDRSSVKPYQIASLKAYANISRDYFQSALDDLELYIIESGKSSTKIIGAYPSYEVSDLLNAYQKVALEEADRAGLLDGESAAFLAHGLQLPAESKAVRRALFGYLLQHDHQSNIKKQLNDLYITALMEVNRLDIIPYLYGANKPFGDLQLSGNIGLAVSNFALENGNIQIAADINSGITEIPQGMDRSEWLLHIARVAIIAGQYKQGASELKKWIYTHEKLTPDQADQVLQPVFDLQTVNQHSLALPLLHEINDRIKSAKHTREIAYWIAESYQATRQFIHAADYYFFSAIQKDNGWDQWGEAARFRAAESLQSANLVVDSRRQFESLLKRAQDDSRRAQIRQKLQELWLLESSLNSVE